MSIVEGKKIGICVKRKIMIQRNRWTQGPSYKKISGITPQLASWDKSTHPSQVRLRAYLDEVMGQLHPFPAQEVPLFLHLDIKVKQPEHLMKYHDLENYLTPLFGIERLHPSQFVLVSAKKHIGGESQITVGIACPADVQLFDTRWFHFSYQASGSVQMKQWKENLRGALAATNPISIKTHPVKVQIAFTCSPKRNWVNLWKVTGDCMGPILGEPNPKKPFSPNDDHITDIQFHCTKDSEIGKDVLIDMWWRPIDD